MKLPTNITIELYQGDPTKGNEGWRGRATWSDPRSDPRRPVQIGCYYISPQRSLPEVLAEISQQIESDIEIINALSKPCGCRCDCRCEQ